MTNTKISKYFFSNSGLCLVSGCLLFLAGIINIKIEKPVITLSKQETALNINKDLLVLMSAGNRRLLTDLLWIQTLIESDLEHYEKRDLNNWLFLRFNTIAALDKFFYENYLYGGLFLGIVKDDLEGADVIYSKGLEIYPDDYRLNYNAGFLRYFELGKTEEALVSLKKIQNNPKAPVFINSIINKLLLATGAGLEEVFGYVLYNYNTTTDQKLKVKLRSDLYAIRAEIDLKCLNSGNPDCSHKDIEGNPYINKNGTWHSARAFLPYRITQRGKDLGPKRPKNVNTFK